jgi:hypothetical protein
MRRVRFKSPVGSVSQCRRHQGETRNGNITSKYLYLADSPDPPGFDFIAGLGDPGTGSSDPP